MRALVACLLLVCASAAYGQGPRYNLQFQALEFETGSATKMAVYGLATGAAGFLLGGLVGAALSGHHDDHDSWVDALQGAVIGGTVGESLMLPVGVHLANDRRGDLLLSMPASVAIGVSGALLAKRLERNSKAWPALILTPIAQLAVSIAIERSTDN